MGCPLPERLQFGCDVREMEMEHQLSFETVSWNETIRRGANMWCDGSRVGFGREGVCEHMSSCCEEDAKGNDLNVRLEKRWPHQRGVSM